jgi:AAA15 family ATPase/GTPase
MKTPDRRALRRIELKNLLSFGPDSPALELENLNILIRPNGSGKSNLIQALSLLRPTPISPSSKMEMRTVVIEANSHAAT